MRFMNLFLITCTAVVLASAPIFAGNQAASPAGNPDPALGNQTHCPVMGGKIDSSSYTDIQGQRVYHCCPMCTTKLKADPDKYFRESAAKGIRYENNQTACPVSGKPLGEKARYFDYEGRRVFVCSDTCEATFRKNAQTYLNRLGKLTSEQAGQKKAESKETEDTPKGHDHGSHDGH